MINSQLQSKLESISKSDIIAELWRRGDLSYLLHSGQREYLSFIEQSQYIKNVLHCGRGWGKTWFFLCLAMMYAILNPRSRIVYATQTRESARQIVLPTYKMLTLNVPDSVKPQWKTQGHSIDFSNESTIVVEGADDDHGNKLRGAFAHMIIGDELGFWSHADYVINHILLPQAQRVGGKMYLTSTTPESLGHEFYGIVQECKRQNTYYRKTVYDNPRLTAADVDVYKEQCGGERSTMFRREYLCEDVIETSRSVIPEFDENLHTFESKQRPDFYDMYVGMDLGLNDFTHVLFGYYDFELAKVVIENEYVCNSKTTKEIVEEINKIEAAEYPGKKPKLRVSDNEAQQLYDFNVTYKLHVSPANKYDKDELINRTRRMFQDGKILISQKCIGLIHQLKVGIWNTRRTDYERLPGAGHLDGIDALRYLIRSIDYNCNPVPAYNGMSVHTHPIPPSHKRGHELNKLTNWYGKH